MHRCTILKSVVITKVIIKHIRCLIVQFGLVMNLKPLFFIFEVSGINIAQNKDNTKKDFHVIYIAVIYERGLVDDNYCWYFTPH